MPSESLVSPQSPETSIELGQLKLKLTEESSWETIAKILTTILGVFLGIKIINAVFAWLQRSS